MLRAALALLALLAACAAPEAARVAPAELAGRTIRATTTVNMITDLVRQVGGDRVEVTGLMGPGVDPHLYKASAGDVRKLANADVTFYGGLHLEGKMVDILERLTRYHPSVAVFDAVPREKLRRPAVVNEGSYDPHVWFDVSLWRYCVLAVRDELSKLDPGSAEFYARNAAAYLARLNELDAWIAARVASVPERRRVLITAHDAFGYFGERYGLTVRGLQGVSTAAEAGTRDVQELVAYVIERGIRAIFVESSMPRRTVEAVQAAVRARGGALEIGGELFADAASEEGTLEGTYVGMVEHNVNAIVEALQ